MLTALNKGMERFERFAIAWSIILMASVSIVNVIGRNLFQHSFTWAEEITQFTIVWVTFIGMSYAARLGIHIRMTALFDLISLRWRRILMIFISLCTAILMFFLAWHGLLYTLKLYKIQRHTLGLHIPLYLIIMWVPLGFTSTGLQYLHTAILNLRNSDIYLSAALKESDQEEISQKF